MATTTDFLPNEYMVFEADQVLTNDHLNQLFNYLDQQNRWTRNKLIGVGIVCGLHIVQHTGVIEVTSGCGITSQGYLIILDDKQYSYYLPYVGIPQPNDLPFTYPNNALPFYQTFCTGKTIFYLLTDDDYNALEADTKSNALLISDANANNLFTDYAVVLFLEANEMDLKNCDVFDCNNKGEKMLFNIRALLVKKSDLPQLPQQTTTTSPANINITNVRQRLTNVQASKLSSSFKPKTNISTTFGNIKTNAGAGLMDTGLLHLQPLSLGTPQINLKRFNVPYTDIKSTDDVINAFVKLVDDATLSSVADAFNYCYNQYQSLLDDNATGFPTLFDDLKTQRNNILTNYPLFIQYFYDFIDDLSKAYDEFKGKVSQLLYTCCPDENLFPLHLVLGAATGNTKGFAKDTYRTYFMYSPLFAKQENEISETQFLFRRIQLLINEFITVNPSNPQSPNISVLPGLYKQALLSQRTIPYYYIVNDAGNELYNYWSYYKTLRGLSTQNLNYNRSQYSSDVAVLNPLLYDIEKYNFFRIEGHIGINYQTALSNILQQQKNYNLPFDVVAISADQLPANGGTLPQCNMQDLDTDYNLLFSEFSCKVHTPFCYITKLAYPPQTAGTIGTITNAGGITNIGNITNIGSSEGQNIALKNEQQTIASAQIPFSTFKLQTALDNTNIRFSIFQIGYRKGDFMRKYCAANANTIGSVYLASLNSAGVFTNPVQLSSQNTSLIQYYYLFDYIDAVESLMQVLSPATLATIDMNAFATAYQRFVNTLNLVTFSVTEIMNDKLGTSDNAAFQFFKTIEIDMLVDEMSVPVYDCIDERLKTLQSEYASRLQQYQTQLSFYYYYNKHYGLEHKAGVPKGGTFVLVYHPASQNATGSGTTVGTVGNISSNLFQNINITKENEAVTKAKLFMAKQPKITPEKSTTRQKKTSSKADAATGKILSEMASNLATEQPTGVVNQPGSSSTITGITTQNPVLVQQPINTIASGLSNTINNTSLLDQNTLNLIKTFANTANLTDANRQTILGFLNGANLQLVSSQYSVADNVVIADFYVPYLCCSDCPPVAYILPQQQTTPVFSIAGNEYVFTDTNHYPFTTTPPVTNTNVAQDPFTSNVVTNANNLHLLTDANNTLFLQPAMPDLAATLTAILMYQNIPVSITIVKPDATFAINKITDAAGIPSLQLQPNDLNADAYTWTINNLPNIFDNNKSPAAISIQDLKNKTGSSTFNIQLITSYTRNNVTASDTKQQTFQTGVCIDFESFELNTEFGVQTGLKEGDVAFTTPEKIVARVWQFFVEQDNTFGDAIIVANPQGFGAGQGLQMNNVDMEFDYTNSSIQPTQITVQFLIQGGDQNFSANNSDMFMGSLTQVPAQIGNVQVAVAMTDATLGIGSLTLTGAITTFKIGGQGLLIDNVCAQ